ncbi:4'-phosphopantetheinyl transferase superfamily protein [Paeniglutamicibacter gangotriensis]|uniref:4'-phosphopantetheinyl transferase superfamily protein n=1 Tax=Paeniglutamicibacter gangotriensis TaxID=254787 RepID=A0A5B0E5W6_9MICC|nr:4'-phosphopantetheinyl transferase superfamily protein [Paeniglutamicibacter gangotriensis]KAA0973301.1 4'-phosphopantetheinyl transferase superfamily protein [Paeniglutamicibacter gangotriensis]
MRMSTEDGPQPTTSLHAGPWWAAAPLADAAAHPGIGLNPLERARAGGYMPGRPREDFTAGRILVRVLAAELLNRALPRPGSGNAQDLEITQNCPSCASSAHGTPRLQLPQREESFALSYARTAGWLLVGLAPSPGRLGLDLAEPADAAFATGEGELLEDYAYAPAERKLLGAMSPAARQQTRARWWALKEAVAKASGEGLAGEYGIPVVAGDQRHGLLRAPGTRVIELSPGNPDGLGNSLPGNLCGAMIWVPGSSN